ncbi:MAG: hypothetical protein HRU22_16595 [Gammaproteobacteria bacterium]|nr:hypothetical protein [Gammaproteobacteria bacterium]
MGYATNTYSGFDPSAVHFGSNYSGIDLSSHVTTDLSDFSLHEGDLFLVMEDRHIEKMSSIQHHPHTQITLLGLFSSPTNALIYDPFTLSETYFNQCFVQIESAVDHVIQLFDSHNQNN